MVKQQLMKLPHFSPENSLKLFLCLLMTFILCSCSSHVSHRDGPPDFYVDETKIPNAIPKPEPLAKYGNYKSYIVFGKRYYTLRSSRNYDEVGIASWYGTKFHALRTSSGERYDMLGMTAAHKTLPLPTYVEVTNLRNQRKVIVKVNDRGPFESHRLIDLSYVAAKKLGMLGHGTTMVRVKAIDPYTFGKQFDDVVPQGAPQHSYAMKTRVTIDHGYKANLAASQHFKLVYLQVGAFRNKYRAERMQQHLMTVLAVPVSIVKPLGSNRLYRVKVGPIRDLATADEIKQRLRGLGISL